MKRFISTLLTAAMLLATLCGCSSEKERPVDTLAMYTENYEITEKMLTYYFNAQYLAFVNANSEYLDQYGLDTSISLADQECPINGTNWYDYFMDIAKEKLTQCLVVSEMYNEKGKPLTDKEKKQITKNMDTLKAQAKKSGKKFSEYIELNFGEGVTEKIVRKVAEMEALTTRYYGEFEKQLDTSEAAIEKYYEGHKKLFTTVDYLYFYIAPSSGDVNNSTGAHRVAINLSSVTSSEEFLAGVEQYVKDYYEENYGDKVDKKALKEKINEAKESCFVKEARYDSSSAASRWAFDEERTVNSGTLLEDAETGGYHVYFLTSLPARQDYNSMDIRQIVFDPKDYDNDDAAFQMAQETLINIIDNNCSESSFKKFAKKYSSDTISKNNGGLYEGITKGSIVNAATLEEWIFDPQREVGNIKLLQTESYGYHVVYIDKIGKPVWQIQAKESMVASKFNEHVSDMGDDYVVHINDNVVYSINETDYSKIQ